MNQIVAPYSKVLVVSCEAGGARILASFLRARPDREEKFILCLDGPARSIFSDMTGPGDGAGLEAIERLDPARDLVLTGTSLIPEFEREAIRMARERGITTASVVDHWVHLRERFLPSRLHPKSSRVEDFASYPPDMVLVSDEHQERLALAAGIGPEKLRRIENAYFTELKRDIEARAEALPPRRGSGPSLLFICEPVAKDVEKSYGGERAWGYTEFDLVGRVLDFAAGQGTSLSRLVLRLHPNEEADKYDGLIENYQGQARIEKSRGGDVIDAALDADLVLGAESMGLVVALMCGKKVFSHLPPEARAAGKKCCLPHPEIIHLNELKELSRWVKSWP